MNLSPQFSPSTYEDENPIISPFGSLEPPIDPLEFQPDLVDTVVPETEEDFSHMSVADSEEDFTNMIVPDSEEDLCLHQQCEVEKPEWLRAAEESWTALLKKLRVMPKELSLDDDDFMREMFCIILPGFKYLPATHASPST